jgi:hypothetical protein
MVTRRPRRKADNDNASSMLEWALYYAVEKRWPVFPCRVDKRPMIDEWQLAATTDEKQIRKWWTHFPNANVGMHVGDAGMMVIDHDTHKPHYDPGALKRNIPDLKPTKLRARTPRGGLHEYYALAEGEIVPNSADGKLAPAVDVRSFHGYVLLPPSRTADGAYEWLDEGKPAHRSDELRRIASTARDKSADRDNWLIEPDLPENVKACERWLKDKAKISVEGQGGDANAYATAAMCKSFGLSEEQALDSMWSVWNERCDPPWSLEDYDHFAQKVRNAYEFNTSPPGNLTRAYRDAKAREGFTVRVKASPSAPASRFKRWTLPELSHRTPPSWLVERVIPELGYAILHGAPSSFKTFLALDISLSIACGVAWRDFLVRPGRVLYMMGEGVFDADRRIKAWCEDRGVSIPAGSFEVIEPAPMLRMGSDQEAFLAEAERGGRWDMVVTDTVGRTMAGMNDNAAEHARMFSEFAGSIRDRLGAATLAVTHSPKDRPEVILGSGAFEADADVVLNSVIAHAGKRIDLYQRKQKYAEPWRKLGFECALVGQSMVLKPCDPSRTERDKERLVSDTYASQFREALRARVGRDGTARWPDVRASMIGMNGAMNDGENRRLQVQINNWFKRWPDRHAFVTGKRGEQNAVILCEPSDDRL